MMKNALLSFSLVAALCSPAMSLNQSGTARPTGPAGGGLTGTYPNPSLAGISTATFSGGFNAANKLVQLNGSGQYPAIDGALITNIGSGTLSGGSAGFLGEWTDADSMEVSDFYATASSMTLLARASAGLNVTYNITAGSVTVGASGGVGLVAPLVTGATTVTSSFTVNAAFAVLGSTLTCATTGVCKSPSNPVAIVAGVNQVIPDSIATPLYFGNEDTDTQNMHDVTLSSAIVKTVAGFTAVYDIRCSVSQPTGAAGTAQVYICLGGGDTCNGTCYSQEQLPFNSGSAVPNSAQVMLGIAANTAIRCCILQTSSLSKTFSFGAQSGGGMVVRMVQ